MGLGVGVRVRVTVGVGVIPTAVVAGSDGEVGVGDGVSVGVAVGRGTVGECAGAGRPRDSGLSEEAVVEVGGTGVGGGVDVTALAGVVVGDWALGRVAVASGKGSEVEAGPLVGEGSGSDGDEHARTKAITVPIMKTVEKRRSEDPVLPSLIIGRKHTGYVLERRLLRTFNAAQALLLHRRSCTYQRKPSMRRTFSHTASATGSGSECVCA